MRAPQSRMDVLTQAEIDEIIQKSPLVSKYNEEVDRESAFEMLSEKINSYKANLEAVKAEEVAKKEAVAAQKEAAKAEEKERKAQAKQSSAQGKIAKQVGKEVANVAVRGLLGAFGIKTRKRKFF